MLRLALTMLVLLVVASLRSAAADDAADGTPAAVDSERIAAWIADLDSGDFAIRQSASRKLTAAGTAAIPAVVEAAESSFGLEVPSRCVKILTALVESDDDVTSESATSALELLAKSEKKTVAQLAQDALAKPKAPPAINPFGNRFGARVVIQQNFGAGNVRVQQRIVNGQRETSIVEGDKKITITDTNDTDIVVTVQETVNGQQQTKKYEGDDLADLKNKHPEAARIYEKYAHRNNVLGMFRIRRGAPAILPNGQVPMPPRMRVPFVPRRNLEGAIDEIDESIRELRKLNEDERLPDGVLDEALKRLEEAKQQLENAG